MSESYFHSPDRLPLYERVFNDTTSNQTPRFSEMYCTVKDDTKSGGPEIQPLGSLKYNSVEITPRQRKLLREMALISRVPDTDLPVR